MTGYRQQKLRLGLTKCPDLVNHYTSLRPRHSVLTPSYHIEEFQTEP